MPLIDDYGKIVKANSPSWRDSWLRDNQFLLIRRDWLGGNPVFVLQEHIVKPLGQRVETYQSCKAFHPAYEVELDTRIIELILEDVQARMTHYLRNRGRTEEDRSPKI